MREEFEKLAAAGKLSFKHIEPLVALATSGYCLHKHWGFGKVLSVDTVFARFTIDFQGKTGHTMDLGFAAESLQAISKDHIMVRKATDLEGLRQMAALHHLDLIKLVVQSFGGRATLDQVQHVLVPDVITSDWKKWWDVARREMKKDGHFLIPAKKTEQIIFQEKVVTLPDRLMTDFRAAKGLKARTVAANEVLKSLEDLADKAAVATEVIAALNAEIATHLRTQPAVALDAIFARDDLRAGANLAPTAEELAERDIWAQEFDFSPVMEEVPVAKHRRALQSFKHARPSSWIATVQIALNRASAKLCSELAHLLINEGKLDVLKETLARLVNQHSASSELLYWLAKERSDAYADILGPEVFRAMLTAMERDQFNEKRSNRLGDYILSDQSLLPELIESADLDIIRDLTRALQFSPCFDDMDKRSLLARIVKIYPAMQVLITGDQSAKQDTSLLVSWESLERRKLEYDELVHKKLPANSREIALARSYGDLSENFEYKAAKDMQKLLSRRKHELEQDLARARGTDFTNARTDVVATGTTVTVRNLDSNQVENFTILGAWDTDPEKGIISYLTPVAQSVLNHKTGEEVQMDLHGATHRYRIEGIEARFKPAAAPSAPTVTAPPPLEPVPPAPVVPSSPSEPSALLAATDLPLPSTTLA
ncbi:MAG: GreA/GreB family elongation factor [Verrucomicrobia bacterium]|nr:GreA/GreB family elongation factor [Verrucomicrobiota bacterium]